MKSQLKQYKGLQELVIKFLTNREDLRESDAKLICNVWRLEVDKLVGNNNSLQNMTAYDFFANYVATEKISSADSITRARRKVQQENEALRGKNYKARQEQEKEFRKNV